MDACVSLFMTKPSISPCGLRRKRSTEPFTSGRQSGSIQCMLFSFGLLLLKFAVGFSHAAEPVGAAEVDRSGRGRPWGRPWGRAADALRRAQPSGQVEH